MPFPLPLDPTFRKECIKSWLDDVEDRICLGKLEDAEHSWKIANYLYLSLPPGQGDFSLEEVLVEARVKIEQCKH